MRITIEINSKNEMEKISALFKTLKINAVNILSTDEQVIPVIQGDKKIDPRSLFGIWSKKPRSIDNIRKNGWQRESDD